MSIYLATTTPDPRSRPSLTPTPPSQSASHPASVPEVRTEESSEGDMALKENGKIGTKVLEVINKEY